MSVDTSSLIDAIDAYALNIWECVTFTFQHTASDNAPKETGNLAGGVEASGPSGGGGFLSSIVQSTAVSDQGFDYGVVQNEGDGGVSGKLMAAEIDGELVFFTSRAGVPATHWWDDTVDAFDSIVDGCAG